MTFCKVDMQEKHFNRNGSIVIEVVTSWSCAIISRSLLNSKPALVSPSGYSPQKSAYGCSVTVIELVSACDFLLSFVRSPTADRNTSLVLSLA